MAVHPHVPHVRPLRNWPTLGARATLSFSLALFVVIFVLRVSDSNVGDAESTLFLMPIAALALRFGLRGAIAGALVACALVVAWGGYDDVHLSVIGYLTRFTAFLVLGTFFGSFVDHRRRLEAEILRHSEASLDLLETTVAERTRELDDAHNETLQRLAVAAEYRDDQTFQHTERVGVSAAEIARRLGLSSEQIKLLSEAAPLHDVGKLAIPDRILLKPGKLSAQEWEVMKTHTSLGARLLSGSSSPVLQMAAVVAENHHERWDGTGYPNGLAGEAIPLVGRVVAVADVFDALIHIRPYKSAWPVADALAEIQRAAGSHLDPRVVSAFLTMHKDAAATAASASPQRRRRPAGVPRKPRETPATPQVPPSAQYV